jgi:VCBS repeat-containing protein
LFVLNELNDSGARSLITGAAPRRSDLFYDVNHDQYITPVDALLVLNQLNGEGEDHDLVQIRLATTDVDGNEITSIDVGQPFQLRAYVQDLTAREDGGVFAAYVDVEYNATLASVNGAVEHGPEYGNAESGDVSTDGMMDEVGSIDGLDPLGPNELLLFTIPMTTEAAGSLTFVPSAADLSPAHDVLVFGIPEGETSPVVAADRVAFVPVTLQVGDEEVPVAVDDTYEVQQDDDLIVGGASGVLANDINPGPGDLVATLVSGTTHGDLDLIENGSFSYTPEAGFVGQDTFTYFAVLDGAESNTATVTINVVGGENEAPVAVNDEYSTDEGDPLTIAAAGVLTNDTDADGDPLSAVVVTGPAHGTLQLNADGSFTYTPADDYSGPDAFEYVANDGLADSNVATVTITVNPLNDAPVAVDDNYSTQVNTTLDVAALNGTLNNDSDGDNDPLTAQLVTGPSNGTLDLAADGSFSYIPNADFVGQDTFTYVANDGTADSEPATVTITVTGPSEVRIRLETTDLAGTPISAIGPGGEFLLKGYVQDVSALPRDGVWAAYLDVLYDQALVGVNGAITYGPSYPNQQTGNTSIPGLVDEVGAFDGLSPLGDGELLLFSVPMVANAAGLAVFQGDPADQLPAHDVLLFNVNQPVPPDDVDYGSVELNIVAGEPPVAVDDDYATDEDVALTVDVENGVLANDSDPDSEVLTAVLATGPSHGTLTLNPNGSFNYDPDDNFFGTDTFTYRASDGAQSSDPATVTITVNPLEDAPIAVDDFYQMEDIGSLVIDAENGVLANDIEVDGDPMSAVLVTGPANGTIVLNAAGSFTYTPDEGFFGRETFTYRAIANQVESNIATVTIDVGDLSPSSILGYVYADTDNDGVIDTGEARYGGVRITLRGTDLFGQDVSLETRTAADGSYAFDSILRGNYTVTEFQPLGLTDGKDTINGQLSLRNDRFIVELPAGIAAGEYNFGERGLAPQWIRDPIFFASRTSHGLLSLINQAGDMEWYCLDDGWAGLAAVEVELGTNRTTAEITIHDSLGDSDSAIIGLNSSRDARLAGQADTGYLMRLVGDPAQFGLIPTMDEVELQAAAIDAAFAEDDA